MNYAKILKADIANGEGFRVSLWVSGCGRKCPGCFNKPAQDPNFGKAFTDATKQNIFKELEHPWCKGLSLLGGEPFSILGNHRDVILDLVKEVKAKFPTKDIWCWTGYTYEELFSDAKCKEILSYINCLIDGPFIEEQRNTTLLWKGSANQRVLHLDRGNILLDEDKK